MYELNGETRSLFSSARAKRDSLIAPGERKWESEGERAEGESKLHRQPNLHRRRKPRTSGMRETRESSRITRSKRTNNRGLSFPDHAFIPGTPLCTIVRCRSCHSSHACPLPSIRKLRRHRRRRRRRRRRENAAFEKEPSHPATDQSSTNFRRPKVAERLIYTRSYHAVDTHLIRTHAPNHAYPLVHPP